MKVSVSTADPKLISFADAIRSEGVYRNESKGAVEGHLVVPGCAASGLYITEAGVMAVVNDKDSRLQAVKFIKVDTGITLTIHPPQRVFE